MTNSDKVKDKFYEELHSLISLAQSDKLVLLGSLIPVGTDLQVWPRVLGKHGIRKCNSNGVCFQRSRHHQHHACLPIHNKTSLIHQRLRHWDLTNNLSAWQKTGGHENGQEIINHVTTTDESLPAYSRNNPDPSSAVRHSWSTRCTRNRWTTSTSDVFKTCFTFAGRTKSPLQRQTSTALSLPCERHSWYWQTGHVFCMSEPHVPKQLCYCEHSQGQCHIGQPKKRFKDSLKISLKYVLTNTETQGQLLQTVALHGAAPSTHEKR